jgi:hypothetical protein
MTGTITPQQFHEADVATWMGARLIAISLDDERSEVARASPGAYPIRAGETPKEWAFVEPVA